MAPGFRPIGNGRVTIVLQSVALDVPEPSYMNWVADELADDRTIQLRGFSYRTALFGRWDVLHVHWPEDLLRRGGRTRRYLSALSFLLLIARIRLTRRRVVRTLHNLRPHDAGNPIEDRLQALLDRTVTTWVRLNPFTPLPDAAASTAETLLIPHGHYRHLVRTEESVATATFTVLFFGYVKPYKGIERLLASFAALPDEYLRLRIVGRATHAMRPELLDLASGDSRIVLHMEYLSHRELAAELRACDLVALPYLTGHNSGAVLHALSADRPVLVADNEVHRWLADETGDGWVLTFPPPLNAGKLASAVETVRGGGRTAAPRLVGRGWDVVASRYRDVYLGERAHPPNRPEFDAAQDPGSPRPRRSS